MGQQEDLLAAAFELAEEAGWSSVTPDALAERTGLDRRTVLRSYPNRSAVLDALSGQADRSALAAAELADDDSIRDRLFELLMGRLDVLQRYRGGVLAALQAVRRDPALAAERLTVLARSMDTVLAAAEGGGRDVLRPLRVKVLTAIQLDVLRVWSRDDSADMSVTMKILDKRLERAEMMARSLSLSRRPKAPDPAEPAGARPRQRFS